MSKQLLFLSIALALALALPMSTLAADPGAPTTSVRQVVSTTFRPDGTKLVLELVRGAARADGLTASGSANAGCQLTAYDAFGFVIYSYTIWQYFSYSGIYITYFPPESTSSVAYWGWVLTSDSHSHWWVSSPYTAAARGNYTFTQYVAGQPYQSRSGWVQVNISGNGSWSCSAS